MNLKDRLNSSYLLPKKDYEYIVKHINEETQYESDLIGFWDKNIDNIPAVKDFKENFLTVKKEIIDYCENSKMFDYPRFKINNNFYIYYNKWEVLPLSNTTEDEKYANVHLVEVEKNNFEIENLSHILDGFSMEKKDMSVDLILSNDLFRGHIVTMIKEKIPTTFSIIEKYNLENILFNSYVSKIFPGTEIKPHIDRYKDLLRFHLGIQVDPKCKITVGDSKRTWREGKFIVFNHGGKYTHAVKHEGKKPRIILSFDLPYSYVKEFV